MASSASPSYDLCVIEVARVHSLGSLGFRSPRGYDLGGVHCIVLCVSDLMTFGDGMSTHPFAFFLCTLFLVERLPLFLDTGKNTGYTESTTFFFFFRRELEETLRSYKLSEQ